MCHIRVFGMPMHHGMHHHGACCCTGFDRVSGRKELMEMLNEYREELKSELERVEAKLRSLQADVQD